MTTVETNPGGKSSLRSATFGALRGLPPRHVPLTSRAVPAKPVMAATAGPIILFTAGGMRFAVEAGEVAEIRDGAERGAYNGFKASGAIDFAERVGLGAGRLEHFVVLKPGNCSLGVTAVERMTTLPRVVPLPGLFLGAERQWYRGLLLLENEVVPLVRTEHWRQGIPPQQTKCGLPLRHAENARAADPNFARDSRAARRERAPSC